MSDHVIDLTKLKRIIAVDFDGTIVDHEYPKIGDLKPGVKEALDLFHDLGYYIVIWSCRCCNWATEVFGVDESSSIAERKHVQEMKEFMESKHLYFDEIDYGERGKPMADFYIDDKAISFNNNWPVIAIAIAARGSVKTT